MSNRKEKNMDKFDIVFVTKLDHLYTLNISINKILTYDNVNIVYIVTQRENFRFFNNFSKERVKFIDEDTVLAKMTFNQLKALNLPFFPRSAGWYYQQFLKLGVSFIDKISENYVVVDADTIFLKQPRFLDEDGRFIFVKADEYHLPYFENYKVFFKEEPNREFSFISQYMVFNKSIVKKMCKEIEHNFENRDVWNWLIINNMVGEGGNLFSEYETYGHYIKSKFPNDVVFVDLPWLRNGSEFFNSTFPTVKQIDSLKEEYNFMSIELKATTLFGKLKKELFCKVYPKYKSIINSLQPTRR